MRSLLLLLVLCLVSTVANAQTPGFGGQGTSPYNEGNDVVEFAARLAERSTTSLAGARGVFSVGRGDRAGRLGYFNVAESGSFQKALQDAVKCAEGAGGAMVDVLPGYYICDAPIVIRNAPVSIRLCPGAYVEVGNSQSIGFLDMRADGAELRGPGKVLVTANVGDQIEVAMIGKRQTVTGVLFEQTTSSGTTANPMTMVKATNTVGTVITYNSFLPNVTTRCVWLVGGTGQLVKWNLIGPYDAQGIGYANVTGTLNGAQGQGATSLVFADNAAEGDNYSYIIGQLFQITGNSQLYQLTQATTGNGSGAATFQFFPGLVQNTSNGTAITIFGGYDKTNANVVYRDCYEAVRVDGAAWFAADDNCVLNLGDNSTGHKVTSVFRYSRVNAPSGNEQGHFSISRNKVEGVAALENYIGVWGGVHFVIEDNELGWAKSVPGSAGVGDIGDAAIRIGSINPSGTESTNANEASNRGFICGNQIHNFAANHNPPTDGSGDSYACSIYLGRCSNMVVSSNHMAYQFGRTATLIDSTVCTNLMYVGNFHSSNGITAEYGVDFVGTAGSNYYFGNNCFQGFSALGINPGPAAAGVRYGGIGSTTTWSGGTSNITFNSAGTITDVAAAGSSGSYTAGHLERFKVGDIFYITGSAQAANNNALRIVTAVTDTGSDTDIDSITVGGAPALVTQATETVTFLILGSNQQF